MRQKRLGLAFHLRDGDVGQVDREFVAVEREARLRGARSELHQGGASEPGNQLLGTWT